MKAYTDIEQSKKLAEILPVESADMHYATWTVLKCGEFVVSQNQGSTIKSLQEDYGNQIIPCWSLAALLNILESEIYGEEGETYRLNIEKDDTWWDVWYKEQYDEANPIEIKSTEELIDACYEMILKLHKEKLL